MKIIIYKTQTGKEPLADWLAAISKNKDKQAYYRIVTRIDNMRLGLFGDHKNVGDNIYELRFHFGSGYRVYYAQDGDNIILLLCAGNKKSQKNDIKKAKTYFKDFTDRKGED